MRISLRQTMALGLFITAIAGLGDPSPVANASGDHPNHGHSADGKIRHRPRTTLEKSLEGHQTVARSCKKPRSFKRLTLKGGVKFAREGEVFAFDMREIRLGKCEEVEITFENTDSVRHALMLPTLNPMFILEFSGPGKRKARFVTPDEDITLEFHCHVPMHEEMGMHGRILVGKGGIPKIASQPAKKTYVGVGTVIALQTRKGQIVVDHEEIKGFMAAMIMGYPVDPVSLLENFKPGDVVRFTIDPKKKVIVDIKRWNAPRAGGR